MANTWFLVCVLCFGMFTLGSYIYEKLIYQQMNILLNNPYNPY